MGDDKRHFATTRWTVVLQAANDSDSQTQSALHQLCETYWQPLYSFVRGKGFSPDEAADLTQGFFVHVFEKKVLEKTAQHRGKFRSFLLACIQNFMNNEFDKNNALKRGGGIAKFSLNMDNAESRFALVSSEPSPESVFEKEWANSLLANVHKRLLDTTSTAKMDLQKAIAPFLTIEPSESSYDEIAAEFGMTRVAVRVAVFRMREKFRSFLREEVLETIDESNDVESEIAHLIDILSRK
jgi:RNA polymerase sigma-70 factor (ECF subfamily)